MVRKTVKEAKAHFEGALTYIPARYREGVSKADWYTPASSEEAETNYAQAMQEVISKKKRQEGIKAVSNDYWRDQAIKLGAPIIADRIRNALDKWEKNWGPIYEEVLAECERLPARTLDFMANINNRLIPVVKKWKEAAGKL